MKKLLKICWCNQFTSKWILFLNQFKLHRLQLSFINKWKQLNVQQFAVISCQRTNFNDNLQSSSQVSVRSLSFNSSNIWLKILTGGSEVGLSEHHKHLSTGQFNHQTCQILAYLLTSWVTVHIYYQYPCCKTWFNIQGFHFIQYLNRIVKRKHLIAIKSTVRSILFLIKM